MININKYLFPTEFNPSYDYMELLISNVEMEVMSILDRLELENQFKNLLNSGWESVYLIDKGTLHSNRLLRRKKDASTGV